MTRGRLLVLATVALVFALLGWRTASGRNTGDLIVYYEAGQRLSAGLDLYVERESVEDPTYPTGYIYLPPLATALLPVSRLPYPLVRGLWFFLMACLALRTLAAGWYLLRRTARPKTAAKAWPMLALGVLVSIRFVWNELGHGQVNVLVFWLTIEGILAAERKRDGLAGALLAAAIVLKITPAIVVAAYLLRGRWRLAGISVVAALALLLLPGLAIGFGLNLEYLQRFVTEVTPWHAGLASATHNNVGLTGALTHWLVGSSSEFGGAVRPLWLSLDPNTVRGVCVLLSLMLFTLTLFLARRHWGPDAEPGQPPSPQRAHALALLIISIPLISPVAWKPHLALLILPGLLAGKLLLTPGRHRIPLAIGCVCIALTGRMLIGKTAANAFALGGGIALGLVLLYAALALTLPKASSGDSAAPT